MATACASSTVLVLLARKGVHDEHRYHFLQREHGIVTHRLGNLGEQFVAGFHLSLGAAESDVEGIESRTLLGVKRGETGEQEEEFFHRQEGITPAGGGQAR